MKTRAFDLMVAAMLVFLTGFATEIRAQQDAQSFVTINGVVKDARTKRPVPFASVFVPNTHIGTVANMEGSFTFKVPVSLNATHIGISHQGYKIGTFKINGNTNRVQDYLLEPHSILLQEVLVRPQNPRELVLKSLGKKRENYATTPYMLTGFYRETIKQKRDYISISEAVVNLYQSPVDASIQNSRVKIVQGRKSANVKKADTLMLKLQGGPQLALLLDFVRNAELLVSENSIDYYSYELLDVVMINDKTNYVIGFTPRVVLPYALYEGKLYIEADKMAITMAEFSLDLSDKEKAVQNFVVRKPARLQFAPTNNKYLVVYQKVDGIYHLNYVRSELEFYADWRRKLFRTGYSVMFEMAITERKTGDISNIPAREMFNPRSILADMVPVYFEDNYWGDYNYIEPDQSIESAIKKLNKVFERENQKTGQN